MNPSIPALPNKDEDHLKILSILHYVLAGIYGLSILFLAAHYLIMSAVIQNPQMLEESGDPFPPDFAGIMRAIYVFSGLLMIAVVVLNILCARDLRTNNNRILSFITSGVNCLNVPLGTTLGVFTIIVLIRPSVIDRYESKKRH